MAAEAIETLAEIMRNIGAPPAACIAAINSILDRDLGKQMQLTQQQQQLGPDGQPIAPAFIVNVSQYPEPPPGSEAVGRSRRNGQ